ncbi:MAG: SusD/RagB family nutrient-binding outer membrane lipoprotein [Chitinophagaceae bacterium]
MKKQYKINVLVFTGIVLIMGACTKNFEEINTNPTQPTVVPLSNLFDGVLVNFNRAYMVPGGQEANYDGSRLAVGQNTYSGTGVEWATYYQALKNIRKVIKDAEAAGNTNMQAAALTYSAQMTQIITDQYRDMPYSDAIRAEEGDLTPEYDTQDKIYQQIIADLKKAADLFKSGGAGLLGPGDVLNGGSVGKWQKYCNSLRLRVALRISNVDLTTSKTIINEVLGNATDYPVMTSNSENVELKWPGTSPWESIFWVNWKLYHHNGAGKILVDYLNTYADPRLPIWFVPATTDGKYRGAEYVGFSAPNVREDISDFNPNFVDGTRGPDGYFRYAEVCFLKAEMFQRGIVTGDAQAEYYKGIDASMLQYGVAPAKAVTYKTVTGVLWTNTADDLNKIYIQKYLSQFLMKNEAWAEARRTDVPLLPVASGSFVTGHNRAPFRYPYPLSELSLNSKNVGLFSGNIKDFYWGQKMWWDTRTGVQ